MILIYYLLIYLFVHAFGNNLLTVYQIPNWCYYLIAVWGSSRFTLWGSVFIAVNCGEGNNVYLMGSLRVERK